MWKLSNDNIKVNNKRDVFYNPLKNKKIEKRQQKNIFISTNLMDEEIKDKNKKKIKSFL